MKKLSEEIDDTLRHSAARGSITPEAKALLERAKREALERETQTPSLSCGICQAPAYWDGRFHVCGANPGHVADANTGIFSDCSFPTTPTP
jgi:hypothetical protein